MSDGMSILPCESKDADVAQLAERRFRKPQVVGSIPTIGSREIKGLRQKRDPFTFEMAQFWDSLKTVL